MTKNPFQNLNPEQKEALDFTKNLLVGRVIYGVVRATLVHAIGRKIAPNVFTSFGRTYALSVLVRAVTARPQVGEEGKKKILAVQKLLNNAQTNFGDHDDVIKG